MHYSSGSLTFIILAIGSFIVVVLGVIVCVARFMAGILEEPGEDDG